MKKFGTMFEGRRRVAMTFEKPSLTKQALKDECDVNKIMRRYERDGIIEHVNRFKGSYADVSEVPEDYQSALQHIALAEDMFLTLPATLRKRFGNDPGAFLAFVSDVANEDEMRALGLLPRLQATSDGVPPSPAAAPDVEGRENAAETTEG